jgi:hypothetical protein
LSARAVPSAAVSDEEEPVEAQSGEHRDELPEDLDASAFVGPYTFPDNKRRRIPGYIYIGLGLLCELLWFTAGADAVLVNKGILAAGIALLLIGGPVGHASAQMGWRGLRSRPTWRILLYSADEPPAKRGLVLVDGVDGEVVSAFVEDNPEDWSQFD